MECVEGFYIWDERCSETPWNKLRRDGGHQEAKASSAQGEVCPKKVSGDGKFPGAGVGGKAKVITVDIWKIPALCFATNNASHIK